jgi:hypothetical protein
MMLSPKEGPPGVDRTLIAFYPGNVVAGHQGIPPQ